jgi:hypothetical protein
MASMDYNKHHERQLVLRSLLPSISSLVGSFVFALVLIGFHLLLLSQESELVLPHFTGVVNDQVADVYATAVLAPLDRTFGSSTFGILSTALVWGLVGWVIYALLDYIITSIKEWRTSESDVAIQAKNKMVKHPMQRQIIIRNLWRFMLSVVLVAYTISIQPVVSELFEQDIAFLRSSSLSEMLTHLGIAIGGWLLVFHIYIILFRLFVFRTRVFGEIIY